MDALQREHISRRIHSIEKLQNRSIFFRLSSMFFKYVILHLVRIFCKLNIISKVKLRVKLFWNGSRFSIDLPAHTDIVLYGCKVSQSDFLLQRYFNNYLKEDSVFVDIGASIGYYSLFASEIIGLNGTVYSFEPSKNAYNILNKNVEKKDNIRTFNIAIGDTNGNCIINEFSTKYNEYNTLVLDDFIMSSQWINQSVQIKNSIPMRTLDSIVDDLNIKPNVIKIDIEGSEELLLNGMSDLIINNRPDFVFRYWPTIRDNSTQTKVFQKLHGFGYQVISLKNNTIIPFNKLSDYKFEYVLLKKI